MNAAEHAEMQDLLDLLLPRKNYLRPGEVAEALNFDLKTVDHLFGRNEAGSASGAKLHGFDFVANGDGSRPHKRIKRDSVICLLIQRSNYTPAEARARLLEVIEKLPLRELLLLQQALAQLIRRKA